MNVVNRVNKIILVTGALVASSAAWAGDGAQTTVTWESAAGAAPIPTMGAVGMLLAALLLAVAGFRVLKADPAKGKWLAVVAVCGSVMFSVQGITGVGFVLDTPGECMGGSQAYAYDQPIQLANGCDAPVKIIDYQYPLIIQPGCAEFVESCPLGTVVEDGDSCTLNHTSFAGCGQNG